MDSSSNVIAKRHGAARAAGVRCAVTRALIAACALGSIALGATPALGSVDASGAEITTATESPAAELRSAPETTPCSSSPFVSSPKSKVWYRVPAIIMNANGDLLAFAEKRDNDKIDMGNFDIVMRKSINGGRTWGPLKNVANSGKNRVSNPTPILDSSTGDVLLVTTIRNANDTFNGIYVQRSTDDGNSFSSLSGGRIPGQSGMTASGHGVTLTQGAHAGRIIVPIGYRKSGYWGGNGIYSDDGGKTWQKGYDHAERSGKIAHIEGTITELPNGNLYISYRDKLNNKGRTIWSGVSTDGGLTVSGFKLQSALSIYSVKGSALSLTGTHSNQLLYSSPTANDPKANSHRRDMGVYVSMDNGLTWRAKPYHVELESTPAAYSDLVQLNDSTVGILYETGKVKWRERIVFRRIPVTELTDTTKVRPSVKAKLLSSAVGSSQRPRAVVTVKVKGADHPAGKITVKFTNRKSGKSGTTTGKLTYTRKGRLYVTLPRLSRGTYSISAKYRGTGRIKERTVSAGVLKVR